MPFYPDAEALYGCLQPLFDQLLTESPEALRGLTASRLTLRLKCTAPTAEVVLDGRQTSFQATYGLKAARPDLDIELSADTLHQILMDTLSMKTAVGNGLIKVRGPAWKLKALVDILKAGREIYPEVLREKKLL
jgi:alkyl sulfatase BDS1-like metallo-beta-lactamase superfamily hydrolase